MYVYIYIGWWFEPLRKILVNGKDDIPYIMENKQCLKPPTNIYIYNAIYISLLNHDDYRTNSPLLAQFQAVRPASHFWFIRGGAPVRNRDKLVNITLISLWFMVDIWYIDILTMVYQQTSLEGQHLVDTTLSPLVLDGWEAQFVAPTGSPLNREYEYR